MTEYLSLPHKKNYETQVSYVKRILMLGFSINTREARLLGIHNLHSVLSSLKRKGIHLTIEHRSVIDPQTGHLNHFQVDVAYMTNEQIEMNKKREAPKPKA